jgi:prepilin-type N-terminal cleavage/methylation domain-containing protein
LEKPMKRFYGLSLIELMITIAVVGIMAAVTIPAYRTHVALSEASACMQYIAPTRMTAESLVQLNNGTVSGAGITAAALSIPTVGGVVGGDGCDGGVDFPVVAGVDISIRGQVQTGEGNVSMVMNRRNGQWQWTCIGNSEIRPELCP